MQGATPDELFCLRLCILHLASLSICNFSHLFQSQSRCVCPLSVYPFLPSGILPLPSTQIHASRQPCRLRARLFAHLISCRLRLSLSFPFRILLCLFLFHQRLPFPLHSLITDPVSVSASLPSFALSCRGPYIFRRKSAYSLAFRHFLVTSRSASNFFRLFSSKLQHCSYTVIFIEFVFCCLFQVLFI